MRGANVPVELPAFGLLLAAFQAAKAEGFVRSGYDGEVIGHVIAEVHHAPHLGEACVAARVDEIGVGAFHHVDLFGQIHTDAVARVIEIGA